MPGPNSAPARPIALRPPARLILAALGLLGAPGAARAVEEVPKVRVVEVPGGGIQPRALADASGVVHLVFLRGEPGSAEVHYAAWKPGGPGFGPTVRVDDGPGSAVAIGTVRGAQLAVGRGGRVHVAWNGSGRATPANPIGGSPLLYARSDEARTAFEPRRNLMTWTTGLDGGGSVAADGSGRVYVAWHGQVRGSEGEDRRKLWVARSTDDGATFAVEEPAWSRPTGACACCGTGALADARGTLHLLYRAATDGVDRDSTLLASTDGGRTFAGASLQPWRIAACPMSTYSLVDAPSGPFGAWETKGQVYFARLDPKGPTASGPVSPPGGGGTRKHPAIAVNGRGEAVLAWAEGTGWQKGGTLAWQAFDRLGRPIGEPGRLDRGVPTWGLPAVVALPDGGFAIIH